MTQVGSFLQRDGEGGRGVSLSHFLRREDQGEGLVADSA